MKELDFLNGINDLDPELLTDRPVRRQGRGGGVVRRLLIAAAAVLLLCGSVYAVVSRIEMKKTQHPSGEQSVDAEVELPLVKWSSFTGEIRTVGESIVRQYETHTPAPDWSSVRGDPGQYTRSFTDVDEAMAYIGLDGLKTPDFPYDDYTCTVTAYGNESGTVDQIGVCLEHIVPGSICAQEYMTILTEAAQDGKLITRSFWTPEFPRDVEFQTYVTRGGNECRIAVLTPEYNNYLGMTAYLAVGPAFCELNLSAVPKADFEKALAILHAWADNLD